VLALNDIGRGLDAGLLSSAPNVFLIDDVRREASVNRAGGRSPPLACRSRLVKLGAA
jgi:hypothetical protein